MQESNIVVSSGFDRFHLMHAAAEICRHGKLAACFTGFYPSMTWRARLKASRLDRLSRCRRLLDREVSLPESQLHSMPGIEAINFLGTSIGSEPIRQLARHFLAWRVGRLLPRIDASVFHYRSGFGHGAVNVARAKGMIALCDHSIAHPDLVEYLVDHNGRFPLPHETLTIGRFWKDITLDIHQADAVLVCSDFVRDTFVARGYDPARLHVIYYGVDDAYLTCLDDLLATSRPAERDNDHLRLIFGGTIGRRKGVLELAKALAGLSDVSWTLDLVGPVDEDIAASNQSFLADPRVKLTGVLSRREFARHLLDADVLLFPSLAEGSARVVFDALAAGCYVITTKNAGSVVRNDVHGALVKPGDVRGIQEAVRAAAADRTRVAAIARQNACEVRLDWRQSQYGERLLTLYNQLTLTA